MTMSKQIEGEHHLTGPTASTENRDRHVRPDGPEASTRSGVENPPYRTRNTWLVDQQLASVDGHRGGKIADRTASLSNEPEQALVASLPVQNPSPDFNKSTPDSCSDQITMSITQHANTEAFQLASMEPPISKASLGELDLRRIINDPKLRHDLNLERELAFRPNYYGQRGEQKKAMAKAYWVALAEELALYNEHSRHHGSRETTTGAGASPGAYHPVPALGRLPLMFHTLRDILKTLVPEAEWSSVDQTLDVDLLMQELENGVCDLVRLSGWLGKLLIGSCSPCRDHYILEMVRSIQGAVLDHNIPGLVKGIEELFVILETMKLVSMNVCSTNLSNNR